MTEHWYVAIVSVKAGTRGSALSQATFIVDAPLTRLSRILAAQNALLIEMRKHFEDATLSDLFFINWQEIEPEPSLTKQQIFRISVGVSPGTSV